MINWKVLALTIASLLVALVVLPVFGFLLLWVNSCHPLLTVCAVVGAALFLFTCMLYCTWKDFFEARKAKR
jgi:hypothetical protein